MNKLIGFALLLATSLSHAGILAPYDPSQSSPALEWREVENEFVRVIYPSYLDEQASFIANLVEHYSAVSGKTYLQVRPKKFPLILRPEFAQPNGFVTLAPRRSEWYTSSIFSPIIGGLNFYQSLAIHEYRHINQFDFMYRSSNKVAYFLFGDFGLSLGIAIGLPAWYLEGDAVWAETAYTDAGRGRSPRFAARLKAMLLTNQIPTYDEFIGRTYRTKHPNHYVFGYYLAARGYKVFGQDIWRQVLEFVTGFSFNPYGFTNAFKRITDRDFEDFYNQTLIDLKNEWRKDEIPNDKQKYTERFYPIIDGKELYYLKKDLDSFWGLYRFGSSKPEVELAISPEISRIDLKSQLLVYTQFLPSPRFAYKSYSDLFSYNLKTKKKKHLLKNQRVYHPKLSPSSNKILVTKLGDMNNWTLSIIDLDGNELQNIAFRDQIISEAVWRNDNEVIAIVQQVDGQKRLMEIDLVSQKTKILSAPTRNNIFSLNIANESLYFEADYKGKVQILSLNLQNNNIAVCSDEPIAAYNPYVDKKKLYFVTEQANGKVLKSKNLECRNINNDIFKNFNYIGNTPSDNFIGEAPVLMPDFNQVISKKLTSKDYSEYTDRLKPHSWSFFSGRGFDLSITGNNYLNSLGYTIGAGRSADEEQPFAYFNLAYTKFYPIFSFSFDYRKRADKNPDTQKIESKWSELETDVSITLPYTYKKGLYNNYFELTGTYGQLKYSEDIRAKVYELSDDTLDINGGEFLFYSLKDTRFREIYPSYGVRFNAVYKKALAKKSPDFSSEVFFQKADVFLPGFFANNGFKFSGTMEKQSKGFFNYRHQPVNQGQTDYVLSRGFKYSYVDQYIKGSATYVTPLLYPDLDLWGWVYFRRVYSKLFFDHTKVEILNFSSNLNSAGAELLFETHLLRKLDLTFGARASHRLEDSTVYDFFLASMIEI